MTYIIYYLCAFISQAPTIINCDSVKKYEWTITSHSTNIAFDRMATFTADAGGVSITFSVWTINNGNKKSDKSAYKLSLISFCHLHIITEV